MIKNIPPNEEIRKITYFVFVGGFSTAINYGVFWALLDFLHFYYLFSACVGYFTGVAVGYLLNSRFTFRSTRKRNAQQIIFYVGVYLLSLALSSLTLFILVNKFSISAKIANVIAIGQSTVTNYLGCRFVVFKEKNEKA